MQRDLAAAQDPGADIAWPRNRHYVGLLPTKPIGIIRIQQYADKMHIVLSHFHTHSVAQQERLLWQKLTPNG